MATIADANSYFDTYVVHNESWVRSDDEKKQRALNEAEVDLLEAFGQYYEASSDLPDEAIYQQALWILRQNETIMSQDFNVIGTSVSGISVQMLGRKYDKISPDAQAIIEQDIASRDPDGSHYYNGRFGWTVM